MPKDFSINISDFTGIFRAMAEKANENGDEILNRDEISVFNYIRKTHNKRENTFIYDDTVYDANGKEYSFVLKHEPDVLKIQKPSSLEEMQKEQKNAMALNKANKVRAKKPNFQRRRIENFITNKDNSTLDIDVKFWTNTIMNMQKKYKIPAEVLATIIRIESNFVKHKKAMGITQIAATDIIQREEKYSTQYNKELTHSIIYDENGKKRTPAEIINKCEKDDSFAVKVGILCFEMQYKNLTKELKPKTKKEKETVLLKVLGNYNVGERNLYIKLAREHLKQLHYDYNRIPFE